MDIGASSMVMSQAWVQESVCIALMKMAMDTGKENVSEINNIEEHSMYSDKSVWLIGVRVKPLALF